ncbi:MAG: SGNH/GDSL hydrolase family protein [Acidobacteria bacterium]|nr:SGNH/GDSL hydrolase family protein [Acidobacteriota bacterium]
MPHDLKQPGLVPFPKLLAVFGYAGICCLLIVGLAEAGAWAALNLYWDAHSPLRRAGPDYQERIKRRRGLTHGRPWLLSDAWEASTASPAYDGYPWAEEFWRDERARLTEEQRTVGTYEPFRVWGGPRWRGKYVNVEETEMGLLRRTVNSLDPGCAGRVTRKVWFLGGSTAWGMSVPDSATIPSDLSRMLNVNADGCFQVFNLGVSGYVSNQEIVYLVQELKAGRRPDIVIFYDGVNDAYAGAYYPALPATHLGFFEIKSKYESQLFSWPSLVRRSYLLQGVTKVELQAQARLQGEKSPSDWVALGRGTLDNYETNLHFAQEMARSYGFVVHFFWHPSPYYGKKPLTPLEKSFCQSGAFLQAVHAVYEEAERRAASSGEFVFLGRIFDQASEDLYVDEFHVGPRGNEMVAASIAAAIQAPPRDPHAGAGRHAVTPANSSGTLPR